MRAVSFGLLIAARLFNLHGEIMGIKPQSFCLWASRAAVAGVTALLCACATPAGSFKDSDFVSRTVIVDVPVSHAVSNFYEGIRRCGPHYRALIEHQAECSPVRPDGSAQCDVYLAKATGKRVEFIVGRVDFAPAATKTSATLRIQPKYHAGADDKYFGYWENFVQGRASEVCTP